MRSPAKQPLPTILLPGNLIVDYKMAPQAGDPGKAPDIFVFGPNDYKQPMPVRKVAEGQYRGVVHIGAMQGLFRIRPVEDSRFFPETGFYRPEEELDAVRLERSAAEAGVVLHGRPILAEARLRCSIRADGLRRLVNATVARTARPCDCA